MDLPIRFQPTALGAAAGTITVNSNAGAEFVPVSGNAPAGKLAVTGSNFFGAVKACCTEERTLSISTIGDCKLKVTDVSFRRKNKHWKLINNPFPATLHPGSCLGLVIRYKATERYPRACELIITCDDPTEPVKIIGCWRRRSGAIADARRAATSANRAIATRGIAIGAAARSAAVTARMTTATTMTE